MKQTDADRAVADLAFAVTSAEIKEIVEEYETLAEERSGVGDRMSEVMARAKARGYDTKILRRIIALRKRHADDLAEEETILEIYKSALGM
ncbi:hypothetical protein KvSKV_05785 [Ketogulonicigenium vulgare]|nr:hypothetical protein KvSKV_05785 [Ketogulonicigenium vulgare]